MNMKRLVIGSLVGLVVLYVLSIVIWEMMLADFFAANAGSAEGVARAEPLVWAMAVGHLLYAVLLTLAVESRSGGAAIVNGMIAGAVVGLLVWGTADFILFGMQNVNTLTSAIADTILEGVRGGITGAVIAAVLGKLGD